MLGVLAFAAVCLLAARASAQSACAQLGVDCSHKPSGDSTYRRPSESDEDRRARLEAAAEARAQRKAEREAKKKAKEKEKEEARQKAEKIRQDAEAARQREIEAQRQRELAAERQRQLVIEAQRRQAAFDAQKPAMVGSLKGDDGSSTGSINATDGLGLKGIDDARPAWDAHITDPQVVKVAKRLGSIVPPLPIPKEEVSVTWKQVYLGGNRLMNTADYVISGWEIAGALSGAPFAGYKILMIGGKTLIAGENGAYLHLVKKEEDYDAALRFLKNPAQSQQFAHLVQDIRQNRPLPANANPAMVKAARAITDPKLGDTGAVFWDAMLSREALTAMLRKATIEVLSEAASNKVDKIVESLSVRKAAFDSVRLEREKARRMLEETITTQQREQWTTVVKHANYLSAALYKTEQITSAYVGKKIGDDLDEVATDILGPEAEMPQYK